MKILINTTNKTAIVFLAFFCLAYHVRSQGNLVVNGGFDTNASGWTLNSGAFYNALAGNPAGSVGLYYSSSPGVASQEISSLTPGQFYTVSGDYSGGDGPKNGAINGFGVALDGIYLFETNAPTVSIWYSFSFNWQATSTSVLLSLSSPINGTAYSYAIDNITMYAVPEPGSLCLIGVGGLAGALFFRRRKENLP